MPASFRPLLSLAIAGMLLLSAAGAHAQAGAPTSSSSGTSTNTGGAPSTRPYWRAELAGGIYMAALGSITSIAIHDYLVDGVIQVTEVTVETSGSALARFYAMTRLNIPTPGGVGQSTIEEGMKQLERLGETATGSSGSSAPWRQVIKNYPLTTHARTIEFRLGSKTDCQALFDSIDAAWRKNETRIFRLK
jgi:hypothetical protein